MKIAALFIVLAIFACSPAFSLDKADFILYNGQVITVDDQDQALDLGHDLPSSGDVVSAGPGTGSRRVKVLPAPGRLSTRTVPPCASAT